MDTERLENSIRRLAQMLEEYERIEELEERLQEAVKESLLQRFEYSWEMAWKTGKRYLVEVEGYPRGIGPNPTVRLLGELGLLDPEKWLVYAQARQDSSHDYSGEKADSVLEMIAGFYADARALLARLDERLEDRRAEP